MHTFSAPIVGMSFRPPAKAILASLSASCPLRLEREPDNQYDRNAIKVFVRSADIPEGQHADLDVAAAGFGHSLAEILAQEEWQLGYIDSKKTGAAAHMAPTLDRGIAVIATLAFGLAGESLALMRWED